MRIDTPMQQPQGILGFSHHRKRSRLVFVGIALSIGALIVVIVTVALVALPQRFAERASVSVPISGMTDAVVTELRNAGVLRYPRIFRMVLALRRQPVQRGTYVMHARLSVWALTRMLTMTPPRAERVVRIIEGWTLRDIGAYVEREGIASAADLFAIVGAPAADYRTVDPSVPRPHDFTTEFFVLAEKPPYLSYEGYLFPDTYRVYADASIADIVRKMFGNFDRKLTPELRAEILLSGRSLHQILTMASIVEAEISRPEDRPIAAGILWKRRDRGMLLQVDASVNYVTGKHDPRVSGADVGVDSAYNTYRYPGLPRGPIGNPGMDAIRAALRPQSSPYWFFLTTSDGSTVFSRTLEEHHTNVARYLSNAPAVP